MSPLPDEIVRLDASTSGPATRKDARLRFHFPGKLPDGPEAGAAHVDSLRLAAPADRPRRTAGVARFSARP